jgi:hypothetical protein
VRKSCGWSVLAGVLCLLAPSPLGAVSFKATLTSIKLYARPGQVLTSAFQLTLDPGQPKTRFKSRVEDWWRSEDGKQSFYAEAGTLGRSCGKWVAINPVESDALPEQTLTIRLTVSVSPQAPPGGYWCVLTVDEVPDPLATKDDVAVQFLASVSTGIFVYVSPLQRAATIVDVSVGAGAATIRLQNDGNTPLAIEGRFEFFRTGQTQATAVVKLPRNTLLTQPIATGLFSARLPGPSALPSGRYLVRAIVDYGVDHYIGVQRELDVTREAPQ